MVIPTKTMIFICNTKAQASHHHREATDPVFPDRSYNYSQNSNIGENVRDSVIIWSIRAQHYFMQ